MKSLVFALLVLPTLSFAKGALPIKHGVYVLQGTPCENPASANLIGYYGSYLAPGHDACKFVSVQRAGLRIQAKMACSDHQNSNGLGATYESTFVIVDQENFVIGTDLGGTKLAYQLYTFCRAKL